MRLATARRSAWLVAYGLIVLTARAIAYAISPSPLVVELGRQTGGPELPIVSLVVLGLALAASAAIVWLAALGVREQRLLEDAPLVHAPTLGLERLGLRALLLFAATNAGFALLESYLHWRAGLGWHGAHCLLGPVHRDAIPLLGALSLLAAALSTAVEHVLAWMRRTIATISAPRIRLDPYPLLVRGAELGPPPPRICLASLGPRAPPLTIS